MIEILLVFALAIGLAWPLGHYLARILRGAPMPGDRVFGLLEKPVYRLLGTDPQRGMSWRGYAKALLLSNLVVGLLVWGLFMTQAWLPLNPDDIPNMRWDLALHTMVSFLTNTNQQHYSGQAQLSYLSQMVGIVGLQVATPMFGLAAVVAMLRALFGGRGKDAHETGEYHELGLEGVDQFNQGAVEGFTAVERFVIQGAGVDTCVPGALQAVGVAAVGDHRSDAHRAVAGARAVDQGLQVTAGAGKQHHDITGLRHQWALRFFSST